MKVPRKLRNGPTLLVDTQVLRWRARLKREGKLLGKSMQKAKEQAKYARESRKTDTDDKLRKKKWFD